MDLTNTASQNTLLSNIIVEWKILRLFQSNRSPPSSTNRTNRLNTREMYWIFKVNIMEPHGLNESLENIFWSSSHHWLGIHRSMYHLVKTTIPPCLYYMFHTVSFYPIWPLYVFGVRFGLYCLVITMFHVCLFTSNIHFGMCVVLALFLSTYLSAFMWWSSLLSCWSPLPNYKTCYICTVIVFPLPILPSGGLITIGACHVMLLFNIIWIVFSHGSIYVCIILWHSFSIYIYICTCLPSSLPTLYYQQTHATSIPLSPPIIITTHSPDYCLHIYTLLIFNFLLLYIYFLSPL